MNDLPKKSKFCTQENNDESLFVPVSVFKNFLIFLLKLKLKKKITFQPNGEIYESFSVFCPCDQLQNLDQLFNEDILIDWTKPLYLNFTHISIMDRIESFYSDKGTIEKLYGDVYVKEEDKNIDDDSTEV